MANKKLGVGVIGASNMAALHMASALNNPHTWLAAICDQYMDRIEPRAKEYKVENVYTDYREMLKNPDVDIVVVCTPDFVHEEMAVAALKAGKHVLCEKPMALTMEECARILEATKQYNTKFMVGQLGREAPAFKLAKKLIDRGEIGELYAVESEYAHDYKYESPGVDNWRCNPAMPREGYIGGGCHAVDLLRWIAGDPTEVMSYANHKNLVDWPVDDTTFSIMKFPNDVIGKVFVSIGCKREYTMRTVLSGTEGTIICDNKNPYITVFKEGLMDSDSLFSDRKHSYTVPVKLPVKIKDHNTDGELETLVDHILNDTPVDLNAWEGSATVAVCVAAVKSTKTGVPEKINYLEK